MSEKIALFLSARSLFVRIRDRKVTQAELDQAIFCLDRPYAILVEYRHNLDLIDLFGKELKRAEEVHSQVIGTLIHAESDHRVLWPPKNPKYAYDYLNRILKVHGMEPLVRPRGENWVFSATAIAFLVREQGLPIEVVY